MNFEEILNARDSSALRQKSLMGDLYRKQLDSKYRYVIDLQPRLVDSLLFGEALKRDNEWSAQHASQQQMQGTLHGDSNGVYEIELESGNIQTLAALLEATPAVVAAKDFIDGVFSALADYLDSLHGEGVYQLCLAPQSIFVRKGSRQPLVLTHGSFYQKACDPGVLYADCASFVAPEVMAGEQGDERSDVYALGRLVEFLFEQGEMSYEYRQMVKKATAEKPADRFQTMGEMKRALENKRNTRRTLMALVAAVVVSLLAVWVYIEWLPEANTVEFVEPAPKTEEDPFARYLDPEMEMLGDSIPMTDEDRMYQQKAEEIFRRRYAQEADRILSEIYDDQRMSATEKNYMAGSQQKAEELIKLQTEMGQQAGLSDEEAGRIAQEIVDKITKEKQAQLTHRGYIKPGENENEEE
jgi:hypothetical protein